MAAIIKRDSQVETPTGRSVRPIAFSFDEMAGRADEYLASVRKEAAKIVQQAHSEAEQVRRNAEQAGREAAEKAIESILNQRVAQQMKTLKPALQSVAQQINDARGEWLVEWENSALHLATKIAEKILRRQLDNAPDAPLNLIRESLKLASGSAKVTLKLNPTDCKYLNEAAEDIVSSLKELAPTTIVADSTITRGGCRVTTDFGEIDQRIESQLERLEKELVA